MASWEEVERLRLEADTIMTRYQEVAETLAEARDEAGDHWETGELPVTVDTPDGEPITITLDFEADLERQEQIDAQLAPLPAHPVAYLICYHLDYVDGDYGKSMAGHLDAKRERVDALCEEMEEAGVLERIESGTVKQRNVKAKKADEVRQHHTYYRLSRDGDHLLRFLAEPEGQLNVLRHLPDGHQTLRWLLSTGPASPRATADHLDMEFEYARHLYRTLRQVGLVLECNSDKTRAKSHQPLKEGNSTFYRLTGRAEDLLQSLEN